MNAVNAVLVLLLPMALAASPSHRIVNGMTVDIRDYPWQGSYRDSNNNHLCGCTYAGGTWTITSGHCGGSSSYAVGYGHTDRTRLLTFSIAYVVRHPEFEAGGFGTFDFSVVRTYDIPSFPNDTTVIQPGVITNTAANPGGFGAITGWGRTCGSCDLPVNLQGVNPMPIISDETCAQHHGNFKSSSMICVFNNEQGGCNGDAGGPLSVNNTIVGLLSWGATGCGTNKPTVFARVGVAYSWFCDTSLNEIQGC